MDGKIFLRLYGQDGETSAKVVLPGDDQQDIEDNFHRGAADVFIRQVTKFYIMIQLFVNKNNTAIIVDTPNPEISGS